MQASFVTEQVIVLGILMAVGYVATKRGIITDALSNGITHLLTSIALPALIFSSFNIRYSKETIRGLLLAILYSLIIHTSIILLSKIAFRKYPAEKKQTFRFGTIFPNLGFMGLPLILEVFGQEAALYASVFMIPYHTLLWTYGEGILSKEKADSPFKKILKTPAIIAILLGTIALLLKIQEPYVIEKPIAMLASLTGPLPMILLGEKITKLKFKEIAFDKDIYYGCFIKLIVSPILTLIILRALSAPAFLVNIIVTMESLPSAVMMVILTQRHGGNIEFASKFAVISHIVSIATIPLISLLI